MHAEGRGASNQIVLASMEILEQEIVMVEAARWCARLRAHDCSERERLDCKKWQASDPQHAAAFAQVSRIDSQTEMLAQMDQRMRALAEHAFASGATLHEACEADNASVASWRCKTAPFASLAMAASIALVAVAVWRVPISILSDQASQPLALEAPTQAIRHLTLEDGSLVHMDAGSKLTVSMTKQERRLQLLEGRAVFEVAHDANRPFSVTSGGTRTVALGTRFEVQRQNRQTTVTLAQGSVAVSDATAKQPKWQERLQPGEQISVDAKQQRHRQIVDAQAVTSWSRGWLAFHATPLDMALREINRYSKKQVLLGDASLGDLAVAGNFIAGDSESIVNAIAEVLPIRVVDGGPHELILFKRYNN